VGAFMRAAYGKGYCDALTEDAPGSLCVEHGYRVPERRGSPAPVEPPADIVDLTAPAPPATVEVVETPVPPQPSKVVLQTPATSQGVAQVPGGKQYTGHPISLDFQGADLKREIEHLKDVVHRGIRDLERRERHLAKRERELNLLRDRVARHAAAKHFIAGSAAMKDVLELAGRVAPLDTTVLVYGESGTGKEFIVRLIHDQSPRASGPFVSINCAALTETLLESELFGHVRGAFTGAVRDKAGLFEVAGNGTIFLDEIGEVAATVQAKLLRALQEREIRRVGAERNIKINARVVAATNRDLRAAVAAGTFREDLYFRLGAFVITVPPLRDRREDIPPLVNDFLRAAAARVKKDVKTVSADAMTALMNYSWPGNVRELEHAIERAVIVANGTSVRPRELPPEISQKPRTHPSDDSLDLQAQERALIERALQRFRGNRRQAADALKISTVTLWRKMKQYGLVA